LEVRHVHRPPINDRAAHDTSAVERQRLSEGTTEIAEGGRDVHLPGVSKNHIGIACIADASGRLHDRLKHGLQLIRRATDDIEYVACRGLVGERFLDLGRAGLHLLKQPRVLDRDHGLVGEGGDEIDLLIGKRSWRRSRHRHDADAASFSQQRDTQQGAEARELSTLVPGVLRVGENVGYVNRRYFQRRSRHQRASARRYRVLSRVLLIFRRKAVVRRQTVHLAVT
jgi:hypothetical protein